VDRTIFALFDDSLAALGVARAFEREGVARDAIGLLVPDPRGRYARPPKDDAPHMRVFQSLTLPELGPTAVTGPLSPALSDGRAGLVDRLTAIGFAQPAARHYFESLRRGQAVVAVTAGDEESVRHVVELMRRFGARAVDDIEGSARPAPVAAAPPPPAPSGTLATPSATPAPADGVRDEVRLPVVEEQLEVGKRQVQRGGVRIHSHVVEEPVQESVSLREERLSVERRPVYRDATEADLADFHEGTIEFRETVEEPVITKRRRVVEEIVVGKETRERTETISDTVRKTQVRVEQLRSEDEAREPGTAA